VGVAYLLRAPSTVDEPHDLPKQASPSSSRADDPRRLAGITRRDLCRPKTTPAS